MALNKALLLGLVEKFVAPYAQILRQTTRSTGSSPLWKNVLQIF